ncbi:MAG: amylo-alpha-1,6-glucosidase [Acidimicrobiales bacterium]
MEVHVGPPIVAIHADDEVVVCDPDGRISSTKDQGYFASDTRLVSGYRLKLGRLPPVLLNSSAVEPFSSRFEFTNPALLAANGGQIAAQTLHLRLDRTVGHGVHEDYEVVNYGPQPVEVDLEVSFECDFADLFDVKGARLVRRGSLQSHWDPARGWLSTHYVNGDFRRSLRLQVANSGSGPQFANGGITFRVSLEPGGSWHTCLLWVRLAADGDVLLPTRKCQDLLGADHQRDHARRQWIRESTRVRTSDAAVTAAVGQAIDDLAGLRMFVHDDAAADPHRHDDLDAWVPAAGVPWFVSLFGRDSLVVSLQTLALSPRFALGALRALGALQGDGYDDDRDAQPGKIEHEVRHGELAFFHLVPHTPYYGTHEATTLYVWAAAEAWRWHGDRDALDSVRPHVERALAWIDTDGDVDGDGLQEYRTRARQGGYYNQGWKDSGEAIVGSDGDISSLPIALCEHQGYVVAAKRAWAEVVDDAYGDKAWAGRLRDQADRLVELIEAQFWWEAEGTYYLGLDGKKAPIESVASNPGHLLWAGAIAPERAQRVAQRLLAPDMWSGWGIRTLSQRHRAYNPFSYQLGSVWPHDNAICAAGFRRYGLDAEAAQVARAMFDAADRFQARRLPELFAGLTRDPGGFPVQYLGANVPQAWASGALVHLITVLLGPRADAKTSSLQLDPALPEWLAELWLTNLRVGEAAADLHVRREPDGAHRLEVSHRRGGLDVRLAGSPPGS